MQSPLIIINYHSQMWFASKSLGARARHEARRVDAVRRGGPVRPGVPKVLLRKHARRHLRHERARAARLPRRLPVHRHLASRVRRLLLLECRT